MGNIQVMFVFDDSSFLKHRLSYNCVVGYIGYAVYDLALFEIGIGRFDDFGAPSGQ